MIVVALGAAALVAGVAAGCGAVEAPSAAPAPSDTALDAPSPAPATPSIGAGGTMLATAFPVGSVARAAQTSVPSGVTIGEFPRDVRWMPGNQLVVPIVRDGASAELLVTVLPEQEQCAAESSALSPDEAAAVADEVCRAWVAEGRLPVVVPDPGAPLPEDPSNAAR